MKQIPAASLIVVDSPLIKQLADQADKRIAAGLNTRTATSYLMTFKLFLAFMVYMNVTSCIKDRNSLFGIYSTK